MELLRRKEDEIQHYQRVQSIGQMSSHIAHEFNNYLTPVLLYGEMLKEDPAIGEENRSLVGGILDAAGQAADLSRKLLDFSRQDTGTGTTVMNLSDEVRKAADMVRHLTPERITFRTELEDGPLYVRGKKGMAEHILMNLCNNAYHAMEGREGILTVKLGKTANSEPDWACLSVSDTGCGIKKDALDKIFEPFYTTKRSGKGTGLGLSVIRNVMLSVGGEIRAESEPGKGTIFYLYFPLSEPDQEHKKAADRQKAERIIVVDDDTELLKALELRLKRQYRFVECCSHPAAVLAKLQNHKAYCDCILTDYDMPSMNGLEFAELVRKLDPEIRLILMSGAQQESFDWYLKNGIIDEFIVKSALAERLDTGL